MSAASANALKFNEEKGHGRKYGSMENLGHLMSKYGRVQHHEGRHVVVLPKLDGAHTSFEGKVDADGTVTAGRPEDTALGLRVSPCKRTGFIGLADDSPHSEPFFAPGLTVLIKGIHERLHALCETVARQYSDVGIVRVDGETVGGHYVHPDVPAGTGAAINKTVQYCPDYRFVCYDIEAVDRQGKSLWLPHMAVQALCSQHNVYTLKPVLEGTFENVLGATLRVMQEGGEVRYVEGGLDGKLGLGSGLSPIFRSTIAHELFGLPQLPAHDAEGRLVNPEEGWVIKVSEGGRCRNCVKFKHPARDEVIRVKRPAKAKTALSAVQVTGFGIAQGYITEERLRHVTGKLSDADRGKVELVKGMYMQDLITEFSRDHSEYSGKKDKKAIQGELRGLVSKRVDGWM
jgi:Rnl2 family RNA ligase